MKILFITGSFPVISETFVINQITGLIDLGHDVKILSLGAFPKGKIHEDYYTYNLEERVLRAKEVMPINKISRILYLMKISLTLYKRLGLKFLKLFNFIKYKKIAGNGLLAHFAVRLCEMDWTPEVVVVHFADIGLYSSAWHECGVLAAPSMVFVHAHEIARLSPAAINKQFSSLFRDKLLTLLPISRFWYEKLLESGASSDRMQVFRMGVDINNFSNISKKGFISPKIKILSTGRLVGQKGYEYSIPAVSNAYKSGVDLEYHIIGDGPRKAALEKLISENGADEYIHLLGAKSKNEVTEYLRNSDIFLLPSVTDETGRMEGIPVALMEAMAMGIPVISTFHSGIPELIEDNKSGFLCPEKDIESIELKIKYIITRQEQLPDMIYLARAHILENYNIEKLMREFSTLLEQKGKELTI